MASLIPKNGTLLNYADQAPSPQKDFCQLIVKTDKVTFRWWKITMRKNAVSHPGQILDSYEDFEQDERCRNEILRVFGKNMLDYVVNLVNGHIDYLPRLPKPLLINIIRFLPLEAVTCLSYTCKMFHELCSSDELWEQIYYDHQESPITDDLRSLAEALGWKTLFFTNKLQLQVKLRRLTSEQGKTTPESTAFLTEEDSKEEGGYGDA